MLRVNALFTYQEPFQRVHRLAVVGWEGGSLALQIPSTTKINMRL